MLCVLCCISDGSFDMRLFVFWCGLFQVKGVGGGGYGARIHSSKVDSL